MPVGGGQLRFLFKTLWIRMIRQVFFSKARRKTHTTPAPFDASRATEPTETTQIIGRAFVVDGDTLTIKGTQIRLFGVDAPEIDHPFGRKAKWALISLCKGQAITASITDIDTHGRTVAQCYLEDGRDISAEMVKMGLALDWPKHSKGKYSQFEYPGIRIKLWLADARQKGRTHVWKQFELQNRND